ncbi:MAG: response regulator transcription factor [Planctomycetota bacterium]|jgi:DNA-binding response OmpR family regulator
MKSVLIIEDNPAMLRGLEDNFDLKGYRAEVARDGEQGLKAALSGQHDLIILDIMLPKINGYEICSQIRKRNLDMPIIMLTAKDTESDIVMGLNLGADDYVTKPFSIKELLARAEAFMRRRSAEEPDVYEFSDCRLDIVNETFTRDGKTVKLSPGQFKMLRLFLKRAGCTLTCDEIRGAVWGSSHFVTLRDIDQAVGTLQDKIEPDPGKPNFIHRIIDIGYKFKPPEPDGNNPDS